MIITAAAVDGIKPRVIMQIHELKIWPAFYAAIQSGEKTFEIRKDDRGFQKGDKLVLREWNPKWPTRIIAEPFGAYTGNSIEVIITFVTAWEQKPGYVVMAIS